MMNVESLLITVLCLLITIVGHELAHGYVALWMGDPTAKQAGRLTLNPIQHLDPVGTLSMLLFRFGWAKPVPINPSRFRNRRLGMILVSLAGAAANLLMASVAIFALANIRPLNNILEQFLTLFILYNVYFAVFNLMPFPPLDGSKVIFSLLPASIERTLYRYERYFYILLMVFLFSGASRRVLQPLAETVLTKLIQWIA